MSGFKKTDSGLCTECGRERGNMNKTNWQRHIGACAVKKKRKSESTAHNTQLDRFFKKQCVVSTIVPAAEENETVSGDDNLTKPAVGIQFPGTSTDTTDSCNQTVERDSPPRLLDLDKDELQSPECQSSTSAIKALFDTDCAERAVTAEKEIIVSGDDNLTKPAVGIQYPGTSTDTTDSCNQTVERDSPPHLLDLDKDELQSPECQSADSRSSLPLYDIYDPASHAGRTITTEVRRKLAEHGPMQPKHGDFPKTKKIGEYNRSFSEHHYFKKLPDGSLVNRDWLSYSTSADKVFCMSCMLHGTTTAQRHQIAQKGIGDWKHLHRRLCEHEASDDHIHSEISKGMYMSSFRIDKALLGAYNTHVAENREIVRIIMQTIIYLVSHNDALRGHDETLGSLNRGRFLDLLSLLSKNHPYLHAHIKKIENSTKKNSFTFMSKTSQNNMVDVLANEVRDHFLKEIKQAGMFAVIIDTTTDLAKLDQFSLIVRYCNHLGEPQERLVALEVAEDATGAGMFALLDKLFQRHNLNWKVDLCAQAYDGAASMQGEYKGLRSLVQSENPRALYVWCFAHILNLVIVDAVDKNEEARNFFGVLQCLATYMGARKRTAEYVSQQRMLYPNQRLRRLKHLSNTRWTSHDRAIDAVTVTFEALLDTLNVLSDDKDRETSSMACSFSNNLTSFKFVFMLFFMKSVFLKTTPLSVYLQTKGLDFLHAMALVSTTSKALEEMRTEECFENLLQDASKFASLHGLVEVTFTEERVRRKKRLPGELSTDENPTDAKVRFRCQVYYRVLDTCIEAIRSRFMSSEIILRDLAFLNPERLCDVRSSQDIPRDAFTKMSQWLPNIDGNQLRNEYVVFAKSFKRLYDAVSPEELHDLKLSAQHESQASAVDTEDEEDHPKPYDAYFPFEDEEELDESETTGTAYPKARASDVLKLLIKFKLQSAFPNLWLAYKGLCTIPPSSASAERSFSKLKIIKSRLRSTMTEERLEGLMILSCEKDININLDSAIDKFALRSTKLSKLLLFK